MGASFEELQNAFHRRFLQKDMTSEMKSKWLIFGVGTNERPFESMDISFGERSLEERFKTGMFSLVRLGLVWGCRLGNIGGPGGGGGRLKIVWRSVFVWVVEAGRLSESKSLGCNCGSESLWNLREWVGIAKGVGSVMPKFR